MSYGVTILKMSPSPAKKNLIDFLAKGQAC